MSSKTAFVILAGGSSSRLGQAKQILLHKGQTLLDGTISLARSLGEVIVVLGANHQMITKKDEANIQYIYNSNWADGMGTSIAAGVGKVTEGTDGIVILLCDQPHVTIDLLSKIVSASLSSKGIIVSKYQEGTGPPCYFDKKYFATLSTLTGDKGAKSIIMNNQADVGYIDFKKGNIDIDTLTDIKHLEE